jgi:hypothetical protein
MILPQNCTVQDIEDTDTETIWYSYYYGLGYSHEVVMEMTSQLCLRGL